MGCSISKSEEKARKKKSQRIDQDLKEEQLRRSKEVKLLLLGLYQLVIIIITIYNNDLH